MPKNIGIAGLGVVAQGFLDLASNHSSQLAAVSDESFVIKRIASRRMRSEVAIESADFSTDLGDLVNDGSLDCVIELIGGTDSAYELIKACLKQGQGVITANKAVLASHGNELLGLAREANVPLAFEAAVAGGIPIIAAMKTGFPANRVEAIAGIINGTCNYILTSMMADGVSFEQALQAAQDLGYAEADPTFDVGGMDAAQKLSILVALAFDVPIDIDSVYCEGIEDITIDDIRNAENLGFAIKHLAIGRRVGEQLEMRVHPALVHRDVLLAKVQGVENAVQLDTASAGVLRFTGPGAGGAATASSVMADLTNITNGLYRQPAIGEHTLQARSIEEVSSSFYLGISAADKPGAIASIGETLARSGISIASMMQNQEDAMRSEGRDLMPVIILTNEVQERELNIALSQLEQSEDIAGPIKRIRVVDID